LPDGTVYAVVVAIVATVASPSTPIISAIHLLLYTNIATSDLPGKPDFTL